MNSEYYQAIGRAIIVVGSLYIAYRLALEFWCFLYALITA